LSGESLCHLLYDEIKHNTLRRNETQASICKFSERPWMSELVNASRWPSNLKTN